MHSFFENVAKYTFPFATVGGKNFAKFPTPISSTSRSLGREM